MTTDVEIQIDFDPCVQLLNAVPCSGDERLVAVVRVRQRFWVDEVSRVTGTTVLLQQSKGGAAMRCSPCGSLPDANKNL